MKKIKQKGIREEGNELICMKIFETELIYEYVRNKQLEMRTHAYF